MLIRNYTVAIHTHNMKVNVIVLQNINYIYPYNYTDIRAHEFIVN